MATPAKELLNKPPQINDDGTIPNVREFNFFLQRLYLLLGDYSQSSSFNIPKAIEEGTNNGGTTGLTVVPNGTVALYINGTKYYLLKAAAA